MKNIKLFGILQQLNGMNEKNNFKSLMWEQQRNRENFNAQKFINQNQFFQ